jgi:hypothetical protein
MIEAPNASRLLSGDRADTNRPPNRRAGRGDTPDKSASGRFVCHVSSPALPLPHDARPLAPGSLVGLGRVGGALDDRGEWIFPIRDF